MSSDNGTPKEWWKRDIFRYFVPPNKGAVGQHEWQLENRWPHVRPNSVLVVALGNHYLPGVWNKQIDMVMYTNQMGVCCWFIEMADRNLEPFDSFASMLNGAIKEAMTTGVEWLLYLDNDVWPEPDALLRIMKWDMPIIFPYLEVKDAPKKTHHPLREKNTGLHPIRESVFSMMLYRTSVFHATGIQPFNFGIGVPEDDWFKTLWYYGHRPYIDTDTAVKVLRPPGFILDAKRDGYDAMQTWKRERFNAYNNQTADRRPIDPDSPYAKEGVYMPFAFPEFRVVLPTPLPQEPVTAHA